MLVYAQPAVDVFIILSGFAIFHLLHEKPGPYRAFMIGRFFRIVPVYWVCLALAVAVIPLGSQFLPTCTWGDKLYLQWMKLVIEVERQRFWFHLSWHLPLAHGIVPRSVLPFSDSTFISPAWSISLEWQFYLVAPLLAAAWKRPWSIPLIIAAGLTSRWWAADFENDQPAFLPLKLHLFILGAGSYFIERWLRTHHDRGVKYGPIIVLGGVLIVWLLHWEQWAISAWLICFSTSLGVWDAALPRVQSCFRAVLLAKPVQWLGRRSYSLYLIHWPLIIAALAFLTFVKPEISNQEALVGMLAVALPLILAATAALHRYIEAPTLRLGRRLSRTAPPERL